jgi:opacity protein-like surface antigen
MAKRAHIFLLLVLLCGLASSLQAMSSPVHGGCSGTYVQLFGGGSLLQEEHAVIHDPGRTNRRHWDPDYEMGAFGGIAIGQRMSPMFAVDLEFSHRSHNIENIDKGSSPRISGDVDLTAFMANAYYRYYCLDCVIPYIGAGVGGVYADWAWPSHSFTAFEWAFQTILGVAYPLCEEFELFGEWRYLTMSDVEDVDSTYDFSVPIDTHSVCAGIRFTLRH